MEQRKRWRRRVEGLAGKVQHDAAVFANGIQHHRVLGLGHGLANDVDALSLQAFEVGGRCEIGFGVAVQAQSHWQNRSVSMWAELDIGGAGHVTQVPDQRTVREHGNGFADVAL